MRSGLQGTSGDSCLTRTVKCSWTLESTSPAERELADKNPHRRPLTPIRGDASRPALQVGRIVREVIDYPGVVSS